MVDTLAIVNSTFVGMAPTDSGEDELQKFRHNVETELIQAVSNLAITHPKSIFNQREGFKIRMIAQFVHPSEESSAKEFNLTKIIGAFILLL